MTSRERGGAGFVFPGHLERCGAISPWGFAHFCSPYDGSCTRERRVHVFTCSAVRYFLYQISGLETFYETSAQVYPPPKKDFYQRLRSGCRNMLHHTLTSSLPEDGQSG